MAKCINCIHGKSCWGVRLSKECQSPECYYFDAEQDWIKVIHAHWIQKYPNSEHPDTMYCSHCNFYVEDKINNVKFTYKFCPNCGASMDTGV